MSPQAEQGAVQRLFKNPGPMKAKATNDHRGSDIIWILKDPGERLQLLGATNAAG